MALTGKLIKELPLAFFIYLKQESFSGKIPKFRILWKKE